jgi:hypothetical protein
MNTADAEALTEAEHEIEKALGWIEYLDKPGIAELLVRFAFREDPEAAWEAAKRAHKYDVPIGFKRRI